MQNMRIAPTMQNKMIETVTILMGHWIREINAFSAQQGRFWILIHGRIGAR